MKKIFAVVLALVLTLALVTGCSDNKKQTGNASQTKTTQTATVNGTAGNKDAANKATKADGNSGAAATASGIRVEKGKAYTDKSHVAAYIHLFKTLPPNYITKAQAAKLGWKKAGTLDQVAPGKSIGGDRFGNFEKILPDKQGRVWRECDIDYRRGNRNAKRICFSNDGLIYYSDSHYQNFVKLY